MVLCMWLVFSWLKYQMQTEVASPVSIGLFIKSDHNRVLTASYSFGTSNLAHTETQFKQQLKGFTQLLKWDLSKTIRSCKPLPSGVVAAGGTV